MRSFLEVLGFELRMQCRSPMFFGLLAVFFAIHLLTMSQIGIHISDNQLIAYNSAYLIFRTELVLSVFGMLPAIIFVVTAATRDEAASLREYHSVVSCRLRDGQMEVRATAPEPPPGMTAATPDLEDVYFATLIEHGLTTNLE